MLKRTIQIDTHKVDIEEKGIKLKLTVVDTPGYGDAIDNSNWYCKKNISFTKNHGPIV
jgi:septin family protein